MIGIDLGTTNSAVAYINGEGEAEIITNGEGARVTPSVILFEGEEAVVGQTAKDNAVFDPLNAVQFVKRQMGNPEYAFISESGKNFSAEELSAIILKKLKQDAESYLGKPVTEAVVTVPAYFDDAKRQATIDAGKLINLNIRKVINEPTAASLVYHQQNNQSKEVIMVYDLGGGTFDATLLKIEGMEIKILGTEGDKNLGGFDFDNVLINDFMDRFEQANSYDLLDDEEGMQDLREKAEKVKKQLSSKETATLALRAGGHQLKATYSRAFFNDLIDHYVERTIGILESVVEEAGLTWADVDTLLMVGGSSRIPYIEETLENRCRIKPSRTVNPDEVVALGAAIQGKILEDMDAIDSSEIQDESLDQVMIKDVNSHSIGIASMNDEGTAYVNNIVLPRNQELPHTASRVFYLMHEDQAYIEVMVTEGEDEALEYVRQIGRAELKLPDGCQIGDPVSIEMHLDVDQLIHIFAYYGHGHQYLGEVHIDRSSNLSKEALLEKSEHIKEIKIG